MRCGLCALASVLLSIDAAWAERLPIKSYAVADGLPHVLVSCIVSDSRGFLWLGGLEGLTRFDGQGFTTYGIPEGLTYKNVSDVLEGADGSYWIATNGGGVHRFTPRSDGPAIRRIGGNPDAASQARFHGFPVGDNPQTNRVNDLHQDRSGRLWAGTDGGLFYLDPRVSPAVFRRAPLDLPTRPDPAVQVWAIAEDRHGNLWVGTSWGLARLSADGRVTHSAVHPLQGFDHVRRLLIDRAERIWIGHHTGLMMLRPIGGAPSISRTARTSRQSQRVRSVTLPEGPAELRRFTAADGVSRGAVRAFLQTADSQIWIATFDGLTEFDGERFRAFTAANGIPPTTALAEDREGNIWLGTLAHGALRFARDGFRSYTEADGLAHPMFAGLSESTTGEFFAISLNQRIHRFDGARFSAVRPNLSRDREDVFGAGTVIQDHTGEWWIPGSAGLYRFPAVARLEQLARVPPKRVYTSSDGLAGDDVYRLFEDSRGDIWIGRRLPTSLVVSRWERATDTFHRYSDADGLPAFNRILSFGEDGAGNVWIGFQNGGLARYRKGRFTSFLAADGVPVGGANAFFLDARRRFWLGAQHPALSRIDDPDADRPRFVPITNVDDNLIVTSITEDGSGRLYLGTTDGSVARVDPDTGRMHKYTLADGLSGTPLTGAFRDRQKALWFASYSGLYRLVPRPEVRRSAPSVLIGTVRVSGNTHVASDLGERKIPAFELEPTQNHLQIQFFALGAAPGDGLRYQYRLEGADTSWNAPTDRRDVTYGSLSPGHYRFAVRGVGGDGAFSENPASVEFTILPPAWERWWFRSGIALGVMLLTFAAHRYRVARLLALERVRTTIAADLHDDIGGSLSRISIQSEVACREAAALGVQPARRLAEIADSARDVVDALGDIVWSVDPRRDDLASVCRRIREYADELLPGSGVRWKCAASGNLDSVQLDPQARRNLFLLLKEAVTNVARHAMAPSASLAIELANGEFRAELQDDGCGFDPGALERADGSDRHGIASMLARAERLGARLTIESSPGIGTTLSLRMPIPGGRMNMLLSRRLSRRRIGPGF